MFSRFMHWLRRKPVRYGVGAIFVAGTVFGVIFWGGFNTFMEYTNTNAFCISCHEMRDTVYQEYIESPHYSNPSGVRVGCADCHVPKEWVPKLVRKVKASNELYHKLMGTIDTPAKFEAKRLELAQHVWDSMKASDSHECRNCHSYHAMDFDKQSRRGRDKMQGAAEKGQTCIDCHKGIAHKLPAGVDRDG